MIIASSSQMFSSCCVWQSSSFVCDSSAAWLVRRPIRHRRLRRRRARVGHWIHQGHSVCTAAVRWTTGEDLKTPRAAQVHAITTRSCYIGSWPSDHYFRSVCWFVCLFVCAEFFSAVFDPISIKLGHMLYVFLGVLGLKKLSRPTVLIGLSWFLVIL